MDNSGNAYCWGQNNDGQLGDNSPDDSTIAVPISYTSGLTAGTVAQITSGAYHTCALNTSGLAYCWGYDAYGQLGNNNSTTSPSAPIPR